MDSIRHFFFLKQNSKFVFWCNVRIPTNSQHCTTDRMSGLNSFQENIDADMETAGQIKP